MLFEKFGWGEKVLKDLGTDSVLETEENVSHVT